MAPRKKKAAPAAPATPAPGKKGSGSNKSSLPVNPKADKLFTPSQVANIFQVDPRSVGRWAGASKLDYVKTPAGTRRITGESLVANGVCRNCWTLPGIVSGKCACGTNSNE
jgi:hypothetical protein